MYIPKHRSLRADDRDCAAQNEHPTGLRYGEIAALNADQVDLVGGKISVDRTLAKGPDGYRVKLAPKTEAGRRQVPLAREVRPLLSARISVAGRGNILFPRGDGQPVQAATASNAIRPIAQKLNVAKGFHPSRHYFASMLLARNIPIVRVSKILGHSGVRTTLDTYAHLIPDPNGDSAVLEAISGSGMASQSHRNIVK